MGMTNRWMTVQHVDGHLELIYRRSHRMTGMIYTLIQGLIKGLSMLQTKSFVQSVVCPRLKAKRFLAALNGHRGETRPVNNQDIDAHFQSLLEGIHGHK